MARHIFFYVHPENLGGRWTHFDFRIFFRWVGEKPPTTSFFQVTFWSPQWRSLNPWKGSLKSTKKVTGKNLVVCNHLEESGLQGGFQWIPGGPKVSNTVDGSEIRLTSWYGKYAIIFSWFYTSKRWLALGFLNHQWSTRFSGGSHTFPKHLCHNMPHDRWTRFMEIFGFPNPSSSPQKRNWTTFIKVKGLLVIDMCHIDIYGHIRYLDTISVEGLFLIFCRALCMYLGT